jgi:aspartate kinase
VDISSPWLTSSSVSALEEASAAASASVVIFSASAGVTNILVALAEGLEPTERFSQLDALRQIQFGDD